MTFDEMAEILERAAIWDALRMADSPGGGMILPSCKYYEFQELTEAELDELYELLNGPRTSQTSGN